VSALKCQRVQEYLVECVGQINVEEYWIINLLQFIVAMYLLIVTQKRIKG
jgi:hypothetical protein